MRKRYSEPEIIHLLRAIEVKISGGMGTEAACRRLGVSDKRYDRRGQHGTHRGQALQGPGKGEWATTSDRIGP